MIRLVWLLIFFSIAVFAQVPQASRIYLVELENAPYSSTSSSTNMPWMVYHTNHQGTKATQFYAETHPSIGNYFAMTTGQIVTNNDSYTSTVSVDNIVRHFLLDGVTWKSYAESLPYAGYTGGNTGYYVIRHNPFAYFSDVRNSSVQKMNLVPFTQFAIDYKNGTLPRFVYIVPNKKNDAHDCPIGMTTCTLAQKLQHADAWMKANIGFLLNSPGFQAGGHDLLIITFDESSSGDTAYGGGHIWTCFIGPDVKIGVNDTTHYNHYNLLRTMMDALGATHGYPGKAATSSSMTRMYK